VGDRALLGLFLKCPPSCCEPSPITQPPFPIGLCGPYHVRNPVVDIPPTPLPQATSCRPPNHTRTRKEMTQGSANTGITDMATQVVADEGGPVPMGPQARATCAGTNNGSRTGSSSQCSRSRCHLHPVYTEPPVFCAESLTPRHPSPEFQRHGRQA
jgi:hypothetical protein